MYDVSQRNRFPKAGVGQHSNLPVARAGGGYKNLRYLLLKAHRMAALNTEFVDVRNVMSTNLKIGTHTVNLDQGSRAAWRETIVWCRRPLRLLQTGLKHPYRDLPSEVLSPRHREST